MKKIFSLFSTATAKHTSVLFTGNIAAALLAIVFTFLAARGLGPENWGIVVAVISVVTIGEAVGDLGLAASLYRFYAQSLSEGKAKDARELVNTAFWLRVASAGVVFLALWLSAPFTSVIVFKIPSQFLMFIAGLGIFSYLLLDFQVAALQARGRWGISAAFIAFVNLLRMGVVYVLFLTNNLNVHSVLWAYSTTPLITILFTFFYQPLSLTWSKSWGKIAKEVFSFSGWLGLNRAAGATASRIDVILLLDLLGPYQTGIFGAAKQLAIGVPILIGSLASVLAPKFATINTSSIANYFKKTVWLSVILSGGLVLGIFISPFVVNLFGEKYSVSLPILRWLLAGYIPFVLATPAVNLLIYAFHKPKIIGVLSLLQVPLVWGLNTYLIPQFGIWGAVGVHIIWNLSTLIVAYTFVAYYLKYKEK